ncbi:MAG: hypothetical protein KUG82_18935 [Pseudomonadales bacterium]|mgnify:CR=1 FL=1|nr:hypothetical protein [Pseudomonadales bacterium]
MKKRAARKQPPKSQSNITKEPTKQETILTLLLKRGKYTRFDVEPYGDHCLNSTISDLTNKRGLKISRERTTVPSKHTSKPVPCSRYWIDEQDREPAIKSLHKMRRKRGLKIVEAANDEL